MAQSGYTPIQLYSSPTPGATPTASNLTNGEVAINVADGKLFYKDTNSNTQIIANSAWSSYSSGVGIQGSGTNVVNAGTVQFANSNGVTFGLSGSTVTASITVPTSGIQAVQGSGTNTVNAGTVQFQNSNGVTFGLNGSTITASVTVPSSGIAAIQGSGTNTVNAGTVQFANSNNITFGLSLSTITASFSDTNSTKYAGTGFTSTSIAGSNISATNGTGGLSMAVPNYLTSQSVASYNIISAGGNTAGALTSFSSGTVVLAGGSNITLSQNSNTISIAAGGGNITVSAGTTSIATNNVVFASSNNISFGMTNNTVTAGNYINSFVPMTQLRIGNEAFTNNIMNVNALAAFPITVTNTLVFQNIKQIIANTVDNYVATYAASAYSNTTRYNFTSVIDYVHNIYTKTGDTLSSYTSLNYPISVIHSGSVLTTTGAVGNTATATISVVFPYSTSSNGYVYTTYSLTGSTVFANTNTSTGTVTLAMSITGNQSSRLTGIYNVVNERVASIFTSAPITLTPNTYWVVHGAITSATTAPSITTSGSSPPLLSFGGVSVGQKMYSISSVSYVTNELIWGAIGLTAPSYSDFGPVPLYMTDTKNSQTISKTGYLTTALSVTSASYASTAFSIIVSTTAGTANPNLLVPMITYQ